MSVKRSPAKKSTVPNLRQQTSSNYGSDPQLSINKPFEVPEEEFSPPNYIFKRNKRPREENISPSQFLSFKEEMKEFMSSLISEQKKELSEITKNLKEIHLTNTNIEQSVSLLATQNEEFRKKIELLELQAKKDREYISLLEEKVEDLQRVSRKTTVELKNVPRKNSENRDDLINLVLSLSKTVSLDTCSRDIKDIFRLKGRNDKENSPPIIVELGSTILKTDLLKKTKEFNIKNKSKLQAKHLGLTFSEDTPIYLSEQLTAKGARLFFLSRDLVKSKQYKYCWTAFGKVFVRKDDASKIILIQNEAQVHQLMQKP